MLDTKSVISMTKHLRPPHRCIYSTLCDIKESSGNKISFVSDSLWQIRVYAFHLLYDVLQRAKEMLVVYYIYIYIYAKIYRHNLEF